METADLGLLRYFVKVVENNGYSRASEILRVPKSTLSKAVTRLESELNAKLLIRSTRHLALTSEGKIIYDACVDHINALELAKKRLHGRQGELSGLIRITAPEDFEDAIVNPAIRELLATHPQLSFEINYTDLEVDLVREGYDFALRVGSLKDSRLKAKRIGNVVLVTAASPEYLRHAPKLQRPEDLAHHRCITMRAKNLGTTWPLRSKSESLKIKVKSQVMVNQMSSLVKLTLEGIGIACVPAFTCKQNFANGALVRVLTQWTSVQETVSLVSTQSISSTNNSRHKTVADVLIKRAALALAW